MKIQIWNAIVGVALSLVCIGLILSCKPAPKEPEVAEIAETPVEDPFGKMIDFRFTRTSEGKKQFVLNAHEASYYEDGKRADFNKATVRFYTENGSEILLNAEKGTVWTDTKDIEASGKIVVESSEGYKLTTKKLFYLAKDELIKSDEEVLVVSEKASLAGVGLRLSLKNQRLEILESVKATLVR